jgi:hypothetical protein
MYNEQQEVLTSVQLKNKSELFSYRNIKFLGFYDLKNYQTLFVSGHPDDAY